MSDVCVHLVCTCLKKNGTVVWESFLVFVSNVFEVNSLRNRHKTNTCIITVSILNVIDAILYLIKDSHTYVKQFSSLYHHIRTWLWVRVCWVSSAFRTPFSEVWKWPPLSCQPGKRWRMTSNVWFLPLCSLETLRCWDRTKADRGFSLEHPHSLSDYWLSQKPNPGLALG